jgi:hypothetical protein
VIAGSRSRLALAEVLPAGAEAAELRVFDGCFWATAQGAVSIRSAIDTIVDTSGAILFEQRRSNIQSLNLKT